jgi:hypothetical protein
VVVREVIGFGWMFIRISCHTLRQPNINHVVDVIGGSVTSPNFGIENLMELLVLV